MDPSEEAQAFWAWHYFKTSFSCKEWRWIPAFKHPSNPSFYPGLAPDWSLPVTEPIILPPSTKSAKPGIWVVGDSIHASLSWLFMDPCGFNLLSSSPVVLSSPCPLPLLWFGLSLHCMGFTTASSLDFLPAAHLPGGHRIMHVLKHKYMFFPSLNPFHGPFMKLTV